MHNNFLNKAQELQDKNEAYATAFVVRRKEPSSGKPGDKAIITKNGEIHGWIGGGCTRGIILKEALESINEGKPRYVAIGSAGDHKTITDIKTYAMTCQSGGEVEVFIEPVLPNPKVILFGSSHIAIAIAKLTTAMDFQLEVVMSKPDKSIYPGLSLTATGDLDVKKVSKDAFVIVCTQGENDIESLLKALALQNPYLAFVSSRKKANGVYRDLRNEGVTFDQLATIKTPAGLDIGAKTPAEVAISILAEIVKEYRSKDAVKSIEVNETMSEDYYMNPVCNIPIQKSTAKHILDYKGEQVYFCCDGCKVSFENNPNAYMEN